MSWRNRMEGEANGMQGVGVVILLTVLALAVIRVTIGYYLWLARTAIEYRTDNPMMGRMHEDYRR